MTLTAPSTSGTVTEVQILETPLTQELIEKLITLKAKRVFIGQENEQELISPQGNHLTLVQRGGMIRERKNSITNLNEITEIASNFGNQDIFSETVRILLIIGFSLNGFPSLRHRVRYILEQDYDTPLILDFNTYLALMGRQESMNDPIIPTFLNIRTTSCIDKIRQFVASIGIDTKNMGQWTKEKLLVQSNKIYST